MQRELSKTIDLRGKSNLTIELLIAKVNAETFRKQSLFSLFNYSHNFIIITISVTGNPRSNCSSPWGEFLVTNSTHHFWCFPKSNWLKRPPRHFQRIIFSRSPCRNYRAHSPRMERGKHCCILHGDIFCMQAKTTTDATATYWNTHCCGNKATARADDIDWIAFTRNYPNQSLKPRFATSTTLLCVAHIHPTDALLLLLLFYNISPATIIYQQSNLFAYYEQQQRHIEDRPTTCTKCRPPLPSPCIAAAAAAVSCHHRHHRGQW